MSFRFTGAIGLVALAAAVGLTNPAISADHYGLSPQSISLKSAGPLAFGPDGVLFVGDPKEATVYAIDTKPYRAESTPQLSTDAYNHADVRAAIAEATASEADKVQVADIAVDPESGTLFMSVNTGKQAALVRFAPGAEPRRVNLDKVSASAVKLENPPEDKVTGEGRRAGNRRMESITDLAFAEGAVLVSGLSGASPLASVQSFSFPFRESGTQAHIEIFHGAHGRTEDYAAIRAFIPITIGGQPSLLAGFTCTPLVQFSLDSLQRESKVRGTTVAELGNRNRPLDMIVYEKDDSTYLLVTNSARGVMKIDTADVAGQEEITQPVPGGGTAGLPFEKIDSLTGIVQLDKLNNHLGVVLIEGDDQSLAMKTIELP